MIYIAEATSSALTGHHTMNGRSGFTYLTLLAVIIAAGITLSSAGKFQHTIMRREKEAELLFRGDRIRRAVKAYHMSAPSKDQKQYPKQLDDLLADPRYPVKRRYIRKIYPDPMTEDGKWGVITDPKGGIRGVFSKSLAAPLKNAGFPPGYEQFEGAQTYSEWKFIYGHTGS